MPELPEVETVRRGLEAVLPGRRIERVTLHREGLRQPFPPGLAKAVTGRRFGRIERRGKYLLLRLDRGLVLLCHLGMSGAFLVQTTDGYAARKHDHAVFTLDGGLTLSFHDPRRFGVLLLSTEAERATHPLLAALGPEPFGEDFTPEYLAAALARRTGPVKPALMDAALVVGIGNIYAAEALFRCRLHPAMPASVAAAQAAGLVPAIRAVLEAAIASGGSSLRDYTGATGKAGHFQHCFDVYGREGKPCRICGMPIERLTQAGRSSFFCPTCQPAPKPSRKPAEPHAVTRGKKRKKRASPKA